VLRALPERLTASASHRDAPSREQQRHSHRDSLALLWESGREPPAPALLRQPPLDNGPCPWGSSCRGAGRAPPLPPKAGLSQRTGAAGSGLLSHRKRSPLVFSSSVQSSATNSPKCTGLMRLQETRDG